MKGWSELKYRHLLQKFFKKLPWVPCSNDTYPERSNIVNHSFRMYPTFPVSGEGQDTGPSNYSRDGGLGGKRGLSDELPFPELAETY